MRTRWLVCVLLGNLAWAQAAPVAPSGETPVASTPARTQAAPAASPDSVAPNAAVITVKGVCPAPKAAAAKTAGTAGKTAPADCKTVITRAEFESLVASLAPPGAPAQQLQQLKQQLATRLPRWIAEENAARKKGLDKGPRYEQTLRVAKMNILSNELERSIREEAAKVPPADVDEYYKKNPEAFEEFNFDRLFIPRYKQVQPKEEGDRDEKLTEEQQKAKEEQEKAKEAEGEKEMTALADTLRARAAGGEDFIKLQKEAFEAAGMKIESPSINLPKIRRTGLPAAHSSAFNLKQGDVSAVIADSGGHYIYKLNKKDQLPPDQVKDEIEKLLQNQRTKDLMAKYTTSLDSELNQAYFGSAAQAGGRTPPPPRMPNPRMLAPGASPTAPTAAPQAPAATPPAAPKSN